MVKVSRDDDSCLLRFRSLAGDRRGVCYGLTCDRGRGGGVDRPKTGDRKKGGVPRCARRHERETQ